MRWKKTPPDPLSNAPPSRSRPVVLPLHGDAARLHGDRDFPLPSDRMVPGNLSKPLASHGRHRGTALAGYHVRYGRVASEGMAELAAEIQDGRTPASEAVSRCEMAYYEELIRDTFRKYPALAAFDGESQEQLLCRFRALDQSRIEFDLLLVDEASQVQPVDALGAIARAKQIVVVGDSKQLPPTRFFSRMSGDDSQDEGGTPFSMNWNSCAGPIPRLSTSSQQPSLNPSL